MYSMKRGLFSALKPLERLFVVVALIAPGAIAVLGVYAAAFKGGSPIGDFLRVIFLIAAGVALLALQRRFAFWLRGPYGDEQELRAQMRRALERDLEGEEADQQGEDR